MGKKQQKTPIQAPRRPNPTRQVTDFIGFRRKIPYAAKQRNFFGLTAELNGPTAELQRIRGCLSGTPLPGIRAGVFDAYGTIFDFASAAARCATCSARRPSS
jgi:hypothetical protein